MGRNIISPLFFMLLLTNSLPLVHNSEREKRILFAFNNLVFTHLFKFLFPFRSQSKRNGKTLFSRKYLNNIIHIIIKKQKRNTCFLLSTPSTKPTEWIIIFIHFVLSFFLLVLHCFYFSSLPFVNANGREENIFLFSFTIPALPLTRSQ